MSPSWIWSDKITNERVARVGYNHFISKKGERNNCFSKFSNRVLPPIFISTILQSGKFVNLAHFFPYDVKLRILADSRSFLANQKARNAIVGADNLLITIICQRIATNRIASFCIDHRWRQMAFFMFVKMGKAPLSRASRDIKQLLCEQSLYKTNRFHVAVHLSSNRSLRTSKCGKNISDTLSYRLGCHFFVLTTFWRHLWSITGQMHGNMESIC